MVTIYKLTNTVNDKVYIGQTIQSLEQRFKCHISDSKRRSCMKISDAIKEYGSHCFFMHPIVSGDFTPQLSDFLEQHYIKLYNANIPHFGYNTRNGGKKSPIAEETKRKLSEIPHRKYTVEEKLKKRVKYEDRYSPEKIIEIKRKQSIASSGENNRNSSKLINIDTQEIFVSIAEACSKYGFVYRTTIKKINKGTHKFLRRYKESK